MVHPGTGHRALATRIAAGTLSLAGIRLLVLAVGRADVLNREMAVEGALRQVREVVDLHDLVVIMLICTPLPWPQDTPSEARKLYHTSVMLKELCSSDGNVQYVKATQNFVSLEGVNPQFIDQDGLTLEGRASFVRLISGKINCGQLRKLYQKFKQ